MSKPSESLIKSLAFVAAFGAGSAAAQEIPDFPDFDEPAKESPAEKAPDPRDLLPPELHGAFDRLKKLSEEEEAAAGAAPPDKEGYQPVPFEFTTETEKKYWDSLDENHRTGYEKAFKDLRIEDRTRILRFFAKYNLQFDNAARAEEAVYYAAPAAEAMEVMLDAMNACYGSQYKDVFYSAAWLFDLETFYHIQMAFAGVMAMGGSEKPFDLEKPGIRKDFLKTANEMIPSICHEKNRAYAEDFKKRYGTTGNVRPQDARRGFEPIARWPHTKEDWEQIDEVKTLLNSVFGNAYRERAAFLALHAWRSENFLANINNLSLAGVHVIQNIFLEDRTIHALSQEEYGPEVFNFLAWQGKHFAPDGLNLNEAVRAAENTKTLQELAPRLTDDFATQVKAELEHKKWKGDKFVAVTVFTAEKEGITKISEKYGFEVDEENAEDFLAIYREFVKNNPTGKIDATPPEGKTKRPFDLLNHEPTAIMVNAFMKGDQRKQEEDKEKSPAEKNSAAVKSFCAAVNATATIARTWDKESAVMFYGFAKHGLGVETNQLDSQFGGRNSLDGIHILMSNFNTNSTLVNNVFSDAIKIHEALGIKDQMSLQLLEKIYGMDADTRGRIMGASEVIRPALEQLGVPITAENIWVFLTKPKNLYSLWFVLADNTTQQVDPQKIADIQDVQAALGITTIIEIPDVIMVSAIAMRLRYAGINITKLADVRRLLDAYDFSDKQRMDFLQSLNIYCRDAKTKEKMEQELRRFSGAVPKLYERVIKKYNVKGDPADLFEERDDMNTKQIMEALLAANLKPFLKYLTDNFGVKIENFDDVKAAYFYCYKDKRVRAFLMTEEARAFFAASQKSGRYYSIYGFDDMMRDYENADLLEYAQLLERDFGVKVADQGGASATFGALTGAKKVNDLDFLDRLRTLGFLEDLKAPETVARFKALTEKFSITPDRFTLVMFLQLNRAPGLYEKVMSPEFGAFLDELKRRTRLKFDLELLDAFLDAMSEPNLFEVIDRVEDTLGAGFYSSDDLEVATLLARTPKLLAAVTTDSFVDFWEKLAAKQSGKLSFTDIPEAYALSTDGITLDELYSKDFNDFLTEVLQQNGSDVSLQERIAMLPYYKNPGHHETLTSEKFRALAHKITGESIRLTRALDSSIVETTLFLLQHPNLEDEFLDILNKGNDIVLMWGGGGDTTGARNIDETPESFLALHTNPAVKTYREILEKTLPYRFHYGDGLALLELTKAFPDEKQFRDRCEIAAESLKAHTAEKEKFHLNDLILLFGASPRPGMNFDRASLEQGLASGFSNALHRKDSNISGHSSVDDLSKLNIFELNKLAFLRQQLGNNAALRQHIGRMIVQDVEQDLTTELGGLVAFVLNEKGLPDVGFDYMAPKMRVSNGAYVTSNETEDRLVLSLAGLHNHATRYNSEQYASPSGSLFSRGGDIGVAESTGADGVLVTSLKPGQFAVHFYTEQGDVVFVGTYQY